MKCAKERKIAHGKAVDAITKLQDEYNRAAPDEQEKIRQEIYKWVRVINKLNGVI